MRVAVLGASGKIGRLTVQAAIEQGYEVTVLVRNLNSIAPLDWAKHPSLRVVEGNVLDSSKVKVALAGQDAVLWTIGAPLTLANITSEPELCRLGTQNVLEAAETSNYLLFLTSIGVGDSLTAGRLLFRSFIRPLLLGRILRDRQQQESLIHRYAGAWTIVRPAELLDDDSSHETRILSRPPFDRVTFVSRLEVAHYLVREASARAWLQQSVVLTR